MLKSYYEILNVDEKASKQEIKFQFKKLAKMYHPDLNSSLEAENIFKEINKAAEVLLDDEKRKNYDLLRQGEIFQKKYTKKYSSGCGFEDLFKNKKEKDNTIKQTPQNGQDITVTPKLSWELKGLLILHVQSFVPDVKEKSLQTVKSVHIATDWAKKRKTEKLRLKFLKMLKIKQNSVLKERDNTANTAV